MILRPRCFVCSADTQKTCGCGVNYCSEECQKQHWPLHQLTCGARSKRDKSPKRKSAKVKKQSVVEELNQELEVVNRNLAPMQEIFHSVDPDQPERLTSKAVAERLQYHQSEINRLKLKRRLTGLDEEETQLLRQHTGQIVLLTAGEIISEKFLQKSQMRFEQLLRLAQSGFATSLEYLLWAKDALPDWILDVLDHAQSYKAIMDPKQLSLANVSTVLSKVTRSGANSAIYLTLAALRRGTPLLRQAFMVLARQLKSQFRSKDLKKRVSVLETELELLTEVLEDEDYDRDDVERAIAENEAELKNIRGE